MIRHTFKPREISLSSPASPTSSTSHTPSKPNTQEQEQEQEQYQTLPKSPCHSSSSSTLPSSLSEAAIVIANNEDLLTQILLCLPPKSLLCFQSVSEGWLSTICNPIFRRLHSLVYPTSAASCSPASLLLLRWDRSPLVFDFIAFRPEENSGEMEIEELICERGVLWNGGLHWISHWNYSVCFDVDNECIGPHRYAIREPGKHADVWYFGESGGRLFYIDVNEPQGILFDVFELELKRDCLYWSVKYQVDLTPLTTLYPQMLNENCSLSFEERFEFYTTSFLVDERKKKASLVISLAGKIISYDINKLTVLELANVEVDAYYGPRRGFSRWDWASQHVKTLACL